MKALVVDDSRAMRMILGRLLKALGFEIAEAGNGQEALAAIKASGPFALALVDWNMPVMNGLELVQAVRKDCTLDAMKIMMVTTETQPAQLMAALEAGATEYLMKPFSHEAVAEKLAIMGLSGPP
jgi:two-component system chemotaxis response regulator CheY